MEMSFEELSERLRKSDGMPLPGAASQYKMTPPGRPPADLQKLDMQHVRQSAVAALFREHQSRPYLILIQRNTYEGVHSGQIGFPGGRMEQADPDFRHTALRETQEEIALPPGEIDILRELSSLYIPPSNFLVKVFVGLVKGKPELKPDPREVARIIELDFNLFLQDKVIVNRDLEVRGMKMNVPVFEISGFTIWGATAMMISELRDLILGEQPGGNGYI